MCRSRLRCRKPESSSVNYLRRSSAPRFPPDRWHYCCHNRLLPWWLYPSRPRQRARQVTPNVQAFWSPLVPSLSPNLSAPCSMGEQTPPARPTSTLIPPSSYPPDSSVPGAAGHHQQSRLAGVFPILRLPYVDFDNDPEHQDVPSQFNLGNLYLLPRGIVFFQVSSPRWNEIVLCLPFQYQCMTFSLFILFLQS